MMMLHLWKIASSVAFALLLCVKIQETNGIRVCGSRLADTLAVACADRGGFHTPVRRNVKSHVILKRDIVYLMKTKSRPFSKNPNGSDILMERRSHGSSFDNIDGVVSECCRRSCTYATLVSYCASTGASTTPPSAFTDFFNKVGYHSSEDISESNKVKNSDENSSSEETQSDQPSNANGELQAEGSQLESQVEGETGKSNQRPTGGLTSGRRTNIGVYSRTRPFFFVVSSRFNGHNDYPSYS